MIKILFGGSPCTHWSIGKQGRETTPTGVGWELFENFLIAKEKFQPDLFIYENVASAAKHIKDEIGKQLNVELQYINSSLVSAQNRNRFYAHNIPDVIQPKDRGIQLSDIIEHGKDISSRNKSYALTARYPGAVAWNTLEKHQRTMVAEPVAIHDQLNEKAGERRFVARTDGKACTLTQNGQRRLLAEPAIDFYDIVNVSTPNRHGLKIIRIGDIGSTGQAQRVYSVAGKSVVLTANGGGQGGKTGLYAIPVDALEEAGDELLINKKFFVNANKLHCVKDGQITIRDKTYPIKLDDGYYVIRKLTPIECERLQTMPDDYTLVIDANGQLEVSNSQRYKALGNGWTAEAIKHILSFANIPKDTPIKALSMYDGIGTARYVLDLMGFTNVEYHAYEIDKHAIKIANNNYPNIIQHGDAFKVREQNWSI